jgi:hypothetical protein
MKPFDRSRRQSGFFDLGMSLFIIAIAGGVIYGAESSHAEPTAASRSGIATEQTVRPATTEISAHRTADAGTALQ